MINVPNISCIKSTEYSIHTRRCFMTGEYCAQQTNIQKERQRLHAKGEINAFVIMNFSSMSDVVYESRIIPFIKQLNKYLYLDTSENRIACISSGNLAHLNDDKPVSFSAIKDAIIESARKEPSEFRNKLKSFITQKDSLSNDPIDMKFPDYQYLDKQHPEMNSGTQALSDYLNELDEKGELYSLFHGLPWKDKHESMYYQSFRNFLWEKVTKIHVHRADSNPVSNYIICNRICQQMQTADLIVVDVSVESANVFYELGLATAFHKLILPICFSESFYEMKLPEKLETAILEQQRLNARLGQSVVLDNLLPKNLEKHIDCYPWRRKLFEHFGIRRQRDIGNDTVTYDGVRYLDYNYTSMEQYGFSDYQYNHFPYSAKNDNIASSGSPDITVGQTVYGWLQGSYNKIAAHNYNSVVLYTMDRILDKEQAGLCIINFYNNVTKPMLDKHCFCGDRVAILGQPNRIIENPKDSKTNKKLLYSVSDLIRIGMDQATYEAERRCIKTSDYLSQSISSGLPDEWIDAAQQVIKTHIRNRCIPLNPETPIYVNQYQNGIQQGLDTVVNKISEANKPDQNEFHFFCLYHVMLDTLRYTNEIVVDLSSNSVQSMFWLGAAHGSNIYTITVRHEMSEKEKSWSEGNSIQKDRPIFDIGGLWTAMLRYDEIDNFYKQLSLIQQGIEQNTKKMLSEAELLAIEDGVSKKLYAPTDYLDQTVSQKPQSHKEAIAQLLNQKQPSRIYKDNNTLILVGCNNDSYDQTFYHILRQKNRSESFALESYYRDCFWRHMLRDNQLHLFLHMRDSEDFEGPHLHLIKWDVDAIAELSHYLSKRKIIGKYQFDTLRENEYYGINDKSEQASASKENFISIGNQAKPLQGSDKKALSLAEYINEYCKTTQPVRYMYKQHQIQKKTMTNALCPVQDRGFASSSSNASPVHAQFFTPTCTNCLAYQTNCYSPNPTHSDIIYKTDDFPHTIELKWKIDVTEKGAVKSHFSVVSPLDIGILKKHSFCFIESTNHIIQASLQSGVLSSYNEIDPNLSEVLSGLFKEGLTLTKETSDPAMIDGNYKVESSSNIPKNLIFTVLSRYTLRFNDDNTATLCEMSQASNTSRISKDLSFSMPAQVILWRELQCCPDKTDIKKANHEYKYHVSLVGVSGPATKALTSLLVDKDQKHCILNSDSEDLQQYMPLNSLQTHLRKQLSDEFCNRLKHALTEHQNTNSASNPIEHTRTYTTFGQDNISKILHLAENYLSTVIYQYFLPFLSQADEKRIYHALEAFLLTLDSKDDKDFEELVKENTPTILKILDKVLTEFRGVEAFYKVHVTVDTSSNNTDNRKITGIEQWCDEDKHPVITCLFAEKMSTKDE